MSNELGLVRRYSHRLDWTSAGVLACATAVLSISLYLPLSRFLIDDTFITLSYARNLAFHGEWALIEGSKSNTATSPLNVLLLAALTIVVRNAVLACGVLFVGCCVLIILAFRRLCITTQTSLGAAPFATALIIANPVVSSSIGLEVLLGTVLLAWIAVFAGEHSAASLGVASGLLLVTRIDLAIVAAGLILIRPQPLRRCWITAGLATLTALPWFAISWVLLGSAIPDTVVIKTGQRAWNGWEYLNGIGLYFETYPVAIPLMVSVPVLGLLLLIAGCAVRSWKIPLFAYSWGAGGLAYYVAYSFLEVPPYHWYYGPPVVAGTVAFAGAVFSAKFLLRNAGIVVGATMIAAGLVLWGWAAICREVVPITTNHATADEYRSIGRQISDVSHQAPVLTGGEIGALAYYCECPVVDTFSDRGALAADLLAKREERGIAGWLWKMNFSNLAVEPPIKMNYRLVRVETDEVVPGSVWHWPVTSPWTGSNVLHLVEGPEAVANE